jgi:hypothetical protein
MRLDEVYVDFPRVESLVIGQIRAGECVDDARRSSGRHVVVTGMREIAALQPLFLERQPSATNPPCGRRPRAAVGLNHVAVHVDRSLADFGEGRDRSQRPADEALILLRAAADLAGGGLALRARGRRAGQHAVLGGDPAFALAAQKRRHALFDRRRADHFRAPDFNQDRSFGVYGVVGRDARLAHGVREASVGSWHVRLLSFPNPVSGPPDRLSQIEMPGERVYFLAVHQDLDGRHVGRLDVIAFTIANTASASSSVPPWCPIAASVLRST